MLLNNYLPTMEIGAQTYEVKADGVLLTGAEVFPVLTNAAPSAARTREAVKRYRPAAAQAPSTWLPS
ncbi:hypothetical protein ACS5PN_26075 [Roseateles sp. NT4]|uniref:hypothetical protein n=1 Tax=Roseateles sp. NT4 TaxID=3453715 RepID=UPI003EEAB5E0